MIVKDTLYVEPVSGGKWLNKEPVKYIYNNITYTIPKLFLFDGLSIPRFLFPLIADEGDFIYAACIHDYLYRTGKSSRKLADEIFKEVLLERGVNKIISNILYRVVRIFGGLWYYKK